MWRALFVFVLSAWSLANPYGTFSLEDALTAPPGSYVRIWGTYQSDRETQALVSGTLTSGEQILRVEGRVFDWQPEPDTFVEMWGQLEPGPRLRFHNGRAEGAARQPRPTPPLREGESVTLTLEVQRVGTSPLPLSQGITEDRRVFLLPKYQGRTGITCLRGEVGFIEGPAGPKALLRETTPCAAR